MKSKFKALTKQVLGSAIPSLFVLSGIPVLYHLSVVWMWIVIIISIPLLTLANIFVSSATRKDSKHLKDASWVSVLIQAFVVMMLVIAEHFWLASFFSLSMLLTAAFLARFRSKMKSIIKNKETK